MNIQNSSLNKSWIIATCLALLSLTTAQANVQQPTISDSKTNFSVGLGVMGVGSPYDIEDKVLVVPNVIYDNNKVFARGIKVGGYLMNDSKTEIAAYLQPNGFRFDPDDANKDLKGLDKRKWSGMAGISYQHRIPYGAIKGQVETDILGNSDGTVAKLSLLTRYKTGDLTLYPSVGIEWSNDNYNDYYFGVSEKESNKTGVKKYDAESSFSPYLNLNATYDINDDWVLSFGQKFAFLSDEQKNSPMVGNDTTYRTTLGLLYKF